MRSTKENITSIEALRRRAYKLAVSPESTAGEREMVAWLLHRFETERSKDEQMGYELESARISFERRAELPVAAAEVEEVNPLDDDERLRQVRIEVFGSAPE